jgi:hypothetical protein
MAFLDWGDFRGSGDWGVNPSFNLFHEKGNRISAIDGEWMD